MGQRVDPVKHGKEGKEEEEVDGKGDQSVTVVWSESTVFPATHTHTDRKSHHKTYTCT